MTKLRAASFLLVALILYYASQPVVSFLQDQFQLQKQIQATEYLQDKNNQIKENKNYVDQKVKKPGEVQLMPMEPKASEYPVGSALDPSAELAPAGELKQKVENTKKELSSEELKRIKEDRKDTAKIIDPKSVEYTAKDGTKVLSKSLVETPIHADIK